MWLCEHSKPKSPFRCSTTAAFQRRKVPAGMCSPQGRCGGGTTVHLGDACEFRCILVRRFSFPGTTTVPLSPLFTQFPWQVPCAYCPGGRFRGEHQRSPFWKLLSFLGTDQTLKPHRASLERLEALPVSNGSAFASGAFCS